MAQHNYRDMAEFLITKGADVNAETNRGTTPLQTAKREGHTEIVELLRKHGAREPDAAGSSTDVPQEADKKIR
jgi:ankyrin repeat protein